MIVLDTHVWVWWVTGAPELSRRARGLIAHATADRAIAISAISAWEVAQLVARGRLQLTLDVTEWIARTEALPFVRFVPVDIGIAVRAVQLPPPLHADPADRLIAATALALGATLVTKDDRLRRYRAVESAW